MNLLSVSMKARLTEVVNNIMAVAAYGLLGYTVCYITWDIIRHDLERVVDFVLRRKK